MVIRLPPRLCLYSLLLGLFCPSCASLQCRPSADSPIIAEVSYSTGGVAPVFASIQVQGDGLAVFTPLRGRRRCAELSGEEILAVSAPAEAKELLRAIELADAEAGACGELEMIYVRLGDDDASVPLEVAPDELREFLRVWEDVLLQRLGVVAPWEQGARWRYREVRR
jgi:hypothetical protein